MLFSLLKHNLDLYISDTVLKVFRSLYCFITSVFHHHVLYVLLKTISPGCGVRGISDAILKNTHPQLLQLFDSITWALQRTDKYVENIV